jgi:hypothetical protein
MIMPTTLTLRQKRSTTFKSDQLVVILLAKCVTARLTQTAWSVQTPLTSYLWASAYLTAPQLLRRRILTKLFTIMLRWLKLFAHLFAPLVNILIKNQEHVFFAIKTVKRAIVQLSLLVSLVIQSSISLMVCALRIVHVPIMRTISRITSAMWYLSRSSSK